MSAPNTPRITTEQTPNPQTLKFNVHQELLAEGTADFPTRESAARSPLAQKLFCVPSVERVFLGRDFVTITQAPGGRWERTAPAVAAVLEEHVASGEPALREAPHDVRRSASPTPSGDMSSIEEQIRAILDREIRPAVAQDGGDIIFVGYQGGVVQLHLQGSCHGCPSSLMTLKMGIEHRLRQAIPEVVCVEAV